MKYKSTVMALALVAVFGVAAHAHKLNINPQIVDGKVVVQSYYSPGGKRPKGATLKVTTPDGRLVFEGKTDKDGMCSFDLPEEKVDLTIRLYAGVHVSAPCTIKLADPVADEATEGKPVSSADGKTVVVTGSGGDIRLRDILGGLGWIVGLTGIAMYFLGRRKKDNPQDVSR